MYDIYYAHHQWKYGTKEEEYELDLIKRYFPMANIFNPATDLKTDSNDEHQIMQECLETVRGSDILVFSSLDGVIGTGVYHEVEEAKREGKIIYYIFHNKLNHVFYITRQPEETRSDRLYATVTTERGMNYER